MVVRKMASNHAEKEDKDKPDIMSMEITTVVKDYGMVGDVILRTYAKV